jgi:membrane-associated protein
MNFENLFLQNGGLLSYLLILILMISNGIINFPSSQILYIFLGFLIAQDKLNIFWVILSGALGNSIGNMALFLIIKKHGLSFISTRYKDAEKYITLLKEKIEIYGFKYLFIAKLIPSVKVFVPIAAATTKIKNTQFFFILFSSSVIWSTIFLGLGFYFGAHNNFIKWYGLITLIPVAIALYFVYKNHQKKL